jgi:hypothetical protein
MSDCAHSFSPHSYRYTQTHAADALHLRTAAESNLDRANRTLADANAAAARHESAALKKQHELDSQRAANEKRAAEAAAERKVAEVWASNRSRMLSICVIIMLLIYFSIKYIHT